MGYTTDFSGEFTLNKPLTAEQAAYINKFSGTRRMKRDAKRCECMLDATREAVGLPVGIEGAYFTGGTGMAGQDRDKSILDYNCKPHGQPGLWCQWTVSEDNLTVQWDRGEKFYYYTEWLEYLIEHFFKRWGYTLNGEVSWFGEDDSDRGTIYVKDNMVEAVADEITNPGPSWDQ